MFALVSMSFYDGYVAGWDSKYYWDFWRPYTAIRAGDTDGNPDTTKDAFWRSYLENPPVQDYPSTHRSGSRKPNPRRVAKWWLTCGAVCSCRGGCRHRGRKRSATPASYWPTCPA